jgi:hypothetical protein
LVFGSLQKLEGGVEAIKADEPAAKERLAALQQVWSHDNSHHSACMLADVTMKVQHGRTLSGHQDMTLLSKCLA